MPVRLTILGSGSSGNCAYLETDETRVLIDAGFSLRQIRQRLATIGRAPENLTGILITHEHSDHVQSLPMLSEKLHIPVYCNRPTQEAVEYQSKTRLNCRLFTTGASFEVGDITVETFMIPHDAQDPVGFLLRTSAGNIGFLTDLGHTTRLVLERVRPAHALVLEANHDVKMLQDCPAPPLEPEAAHPWPARPSLERSRRGCRRANHVRRPAASVSGPPEPRVQPPRTGP